MRRVKERVPLDECKRRALSYMRDLKRSNGLVRASEIAQAIWPDAEFTEQGAGAAASRILVHLQKDGLVEWTSTPDDWGWRLRRKP